MIFKKLIIVNGKIKELLIEQISNVELKTECVVRERAATLKEELLFQCGLGRFLKFE